MNSKFAYFNITIQPVILRIKTLFFKIKDLALGVIYTLIFLPKSEKIKKMLFTMYISKVQVSKSHKMSKEELGRLIVKRADINADPNFTVTVDSSVARALHIKKGGSGLRSPGLRGTYQVVWKSPLHKIKPSKHLIERFSPDCGNLVLTRVKSLKRNKSMLNLNLDDTSRFSGEMFLHRSKLSRSVKKDMDVYLHQAKLDAKRRAQCIEDWNNLKSQNIDAYHKGLRKAYSKFLGAKKPDYFRKDFVNPRFKDIIEKTNEFKFSKFKFLGKKNPRYGDKFNNTIVMQVKSYKSDIYKSGVINKHNFYQHKGGAYKANSANKPFSFDKSYVKFDYTRKNDTPSKYYSIIHKAFNTKEPHEYSGNTNKRVFGPIKEARLKKGLRTNSKITFIDGDNGAQVTHIKNSNIRGNSIGSSRFRSFFLQKKNLLHTHKYHSDLYHHKYLSKSRNKAHLSNLDICSQMDDISKFRNVVRQSLNYRLSHLTEIQRWNRLKIIEEYDASVKRYPSNAVGQNASILQKKNYRYKRNFNIYDKMVVNDGKFKTRTLYNKVLRIKPWERPMVDPDFDGDFSKFKVVRTEKFIYGSKISKSKIFSWVETPQGPRNILEMVRKLPHHHFVYKSRYKPTTEHLILKKRTYNWLNTTQQRLKSRKFWVARLKYDHTYNTITSRFTEEDPSSEKRPMKLLSFLRDGNMYSLEWREEQHIWQPLFDLYFYTVPTIILLLFVHYTLAELLLSKFKCQSHYRLNFFFLNGGFLFFWSYQILSKYQFKFNKIVSIPTVGLQPLIFYWWFFLLVFLVCIYIFHALAPTNVYLRSKSFVGPLDAFFLLIPSIISLLIIPVFLLQFHAPYWDFFNDFIFCSVGKLQFHYNYTYIFFITIFMGFFGVLFFYYILSSKFMIKVLTNGGGGLELTATLEKLLFLGTEDNSDIWDNWGPPNRGLPYTLVLFIDDLFDKIPEVPTGHFYFFTSRGWRSLWIGSYSRNVLLSWYFLMFFLFYLQIKLYFLVDLPYLLCLNFYLFNALLLLYLLFIHYMCIPILRKGKHYCFVTLYAIFLILFIIFFLNDIIFITPIFVWYLFVFFILVCIIFKNLDFIKTSFYNFVEVYNSKK